MPDTFDSNQVISIPPLPISVLKLAEKVSASSTDIEEIAKIIEFDPVLCASVIRWSNSSWSQPESAVTRVWDAVLRLGSENILKLAVGYHLMASIRKLAGPLDASENILWKHSVATALAVETMSKILTVKIPSVAFTAAIMHDIGKVLLGRQSGYQKTLEQVSRYMQANNVDELTAEKQVLGIDHVTLGINIIRGWKIPEEISEAVAKHHAPDENGTVLVDAIYVANLLVKRIGFGSEGSVKNVELKADILRRLSMDEGQIEKILSQTQSEFAKTAAQWNA